MTEIRITTDSHLMEPKDLWSGLPARLADLFQESFPRYHRPDVIKNAMVQELEVDEPIYHGRTRSEIMRGNDPELRIKDNEADGVWGQVIFPTVSLLTWLFPDQEVASAVGQTYNNWLAETHVPYEQLICAAILPGVGDLDVNVAEIERAANMGMRTVILPVTPPATLPPYFDPTWDAVWAAARDHDLPISFHAGGTGSQQEYEDTFSQPHGMFYDMFGKMRTALPTFQLVANLSSGAVFERFPELHFVIVESGAGWLGWMMQELDSFSTFAPGVEYLDLSMRPSDYLRRQVHCTFMNDRPAIDQIPYTGADCIMWGNDYPHREGTWPSSDEALEHEFAAIAPDVRAAVVGGNAARVFGVQLPS